MTVKRFGVTMVVLAALLSLGSSAPGRVPALPVAPATGWQTVAVHGAPGTFGELSAVLPSGQLLARRAVPGWGFPPGRRAGRTTVAADGTVFLAGADHHLGAGAATAAVMTIGAFDPGTNAFSTVPLRTTEGRDQVTTPAGEPAAPPVTDLEPIAGGGAIAFTAGRGYSGQALPETGAWPVFGIVTMVDGQWQVAAGDGWINQWAGAELRDSHPPLSRRACPELSLAPGASDCRGLGDLVTLPQSGDLIVVQGGEPGVHNGALLALRVTGPDHAGRYEVTVTGHYQYPAVRDPATGSYLDIGLSYLHADPTGSAGDERFVAGLWEPTDASGDRPMLVQEFRYDAASGAIAPVSAPLIPGDAPRGGDRPYGYSAAAYDSAGNLWAARHDWLSGGNLAMYAVAGGRRGLAGPECGYDPAVPMEDYVTWLDGRVEWGHSCRPDYDITQAGSLTAMVGMVADPAGGGVAMVTLTGQVLVIRATAVDGEWEFQVGNLVDTAPRLLPRVGDNLLNYAPGAVGPDRRLWFPAFQLGDGGAAADQWLYAIALDDLFAPEPVRLPDTPGQVATVRVGYTRTTGTTRSPGSGATVDVVSEAHVAPCTDVPAHTGCSYDGLPGDGFLLRDRSGYGHLRGEIVYQVEVPTAGSYRVAYRVSTFAVTTEARIRLESGGESRTTAVSTGGPWRTIPQVEPITLPAGRQTIRLSAPPGGNGWYLAWFTLQRM